MGLVRQIAYFLYDTLVDDVSGKIVPDLATSWHETPGSVRLTIRQNARCDDGSQLTAADVAANVNWVANLANHSPLRNRAVPAGSAASVGPTTGIVTIRYPLSGFVLIGLADLPIVCGAAITHRSRLVAGADGTGPYRVGSVQPGTKYTLVRQTHDDRHGTELPPTVVVTVVADESTATNLLLTGDIDAAVVNGPDRSRLAKGGFVAHEDPLLYGEILFNRANRQLGSGPVRRALVSALDLAKLRTVLTTGLGAAPTSLVAVSPCGSSGLSAVLPDDSVASQRRAVSALRGHVLDVIYQSSHGASGQAAAELLVRQWHAIGVQAQARALTDANLFSTVFAGSNWDVLVAPIDGATPAVERGTFSGSTPADGGSNFAHIREPAYERAAASAARQVDTSGCPQWQEAERALVRNADVTPFALLDRQTWAAPDVTFGTSRGYLLPTTVRMTSH